VQKLNKAVDMAYPVLAKVCKEATIDCHLADTRDINPPLVRRGREGGRGRERAMQRKVSHSFTDIILP